MSFAAGQVWSALRASVKSNASLGTERQRATYRMLETCSCVIDKPAGALVIETPHSRVELLTILASAEATE